MRVFAVSLVAVAVLAACDAPIAPSPAPPPAPAGLPSLDLIAEVRVAVTWDEVTETVHRTIGGRDLPGDHALERAIAAEHDVWVKKGKPDVPVTIAADTRVPWAQIINVVNIVKRLGIDKIEFAMGAPPAAKQEK